MNLLMKNAVYAPFWGLSAILPGTVAKAAVFKKLK
jgi:hypothetical protein